MNILWNLKINNQNAWRCSLHWLFANFLSYHCIQVRDNDSHADLFTRRTEKKEHLSSPLTYIISSLLRSGKRPKPITIERLHTSYESVTIIISRCFFFFRFIHYV